MKLVKTVLGTLLSTTLALPLGLREGHNRKKPARAHSDTSYSSDERYLKRLRKYRPPKHVNLGIKHFRIPQRDIYYKAGGLGDKGMARKRHSSSSDSSHKVQRQKTRDPKKGLTKHHQHRHRRQSSSSSSSSMKKHYKKKHCSCKKKCIPKKHLPVESKSSSSSSSSRRSVSMKIVFSQEDAAILGSCDHPAVAVHRRHYSRRLRRSESGRSRSRSRSTIS